MAPLQRSLSSPPSLTDLMPKLKVFSGRAGKDEVSTVVICFGVRSAKLTPIPSSR